jgi:hypothetical protein
VARGFFRSQDNQCLRASDVWRVETGRLESEGVVWVYMEGDSRGVELKGVPAIDFLMDNAPFMLEGRRMRWRRWDWALHNLAAHPLMQLLALCRLHRWAFAVHDYTIPRPKGAKHDEPKGS